MNGDCIMHLVAPASADYDQDAMLRYYGAGSFRCHLCGDEPEVRRDYLHSDTHCPSSVFCESTIGIPPITALVCTVAV